MKITIVRTDNFVVVDGVQKKMDLAFLPEDFHSLQWSNGSGFVESKNIDNCQKLQDISDWSLWSDFYARMEVAENEGDVEQIQSAEEAVESEDPPPTDEEMLDHIRRIRNDYLAMTDVDIIRLLEGDQPIPTDLKGYRQALRDLPNHIENGIAPQPVWNEETQLIEFNSWPVKS